MVANAEQLQKDLEARNEMKDGVLFKIKMTRALLVLASFYVVIV